MQRRLVAEPLNARDGDELVVADVLMGQALCDMLGIIASATVLGTGLQIYSPDFTWWTFAIYASATVAAFVVIGPVWKRTVRTPVAGQVGSPRQTTVIS